jgi:hypothetical protein
MSKARNQMAKALKTVALPVFREHGFNGSFPDLRRLRDGYIQLLTFQFDRHGGGFIIELGRCKPTDFATAWGKLTSAEKVTVGHLPWRQRMRIQPHSGSGTDSWFRFDMATTPEAFTRIAESVLAFTDTIEKTFYEFDQVHKTGEVANQALESGG